MFEWLNAIGPLTWAVLGLCGLMVVAGWMMSSSKLIVWAFGAIFMIGTVAALVRLVAFDGARDPILNQPVAVITSLITMVLLGVNLLSNRGISGSGERRSIKAAMPKFNPAAVAGVVVALLLIVGGGSVILNRLDLPAGNASQGFQIAGADASKQSARAMRIIERFLAR